MSLSRQDRHGFGYYSNLCEDKTGFILHITFFVFSTLLQQFGKGPNQQVNQ